MTKLAELAMQADALYALRNRRLELQHQVDDLKEQEGNLKQELITACKEAGAGGVSGKACRITVVVKTVPQCQDWDALYAYIRETGSFELIQRRLGEGAVKERWEANVEVPGVVSITLDDLSIRKA